MHRALLLAGAALVGLVAPARGVLFGGGGELEKKQKLAESRFFGNVTVPKMWVPISVRDRAHGGDPIVQLCLINWEPYWREPHVFGKFRSVQMRSGCTGTGASGGGRLKSGALSEVTNETCGCACVA